MRKAIIRSIGPAAEWEKVKELQGVILPDSMALYFAEIFVDGKRETMYFDVSREEAKDIESLKQWVITEASKPRIFRWTK